MTKHSMNSDDLRRVRLACGFTQAEMAAFLGVSGAAVCAWENGASDFRGAAAILFSVLFCDDDTAYHAARDKVTKMRMQVLQRRLHAA